MGNARNDQDAQPSEPAAMTPAEAAALLGVSAQTVRRRGREFGRKVLGRWRVDPQLVHRALAPGSTGGAS